MTEVAIPRSLKPSASGRSCHAVDHVHFWGPGYLNPVSVSVGTSAAYMDERSCVELRDALLVRFPLPKALPKAPNPVKFEKPVPIKGMGEGFMPEAAPFGKTSREVYVTPTGIAKVLIFDRDGEFYGLGAEDAKKLGDLLIRCFPELLDKYQPKAPEPKAEAPVMLTPTSGNSAAVGRVEANDNKWEEVAPSLTRVAVPGGHFYRDAKMCSSHFVPTSSGKSV